MEALTSHLVLALDASIDLQMHATFSDGTWTPEQQLDYLVSEQFGLVAITDHDHVDAATLLQQLAKRKQLPVLTAVEMSTMWKGEPTDVLCYGFDPDRSGAVSLIAHPGRGEGFMCYDAHLLDILLQKVPIDGLEVYYPAHTPEQIVIYQEYAKTHRLLTSSGSDSHGTEKKPIKYRAELSRSLLERLGIRLN